MRLLFLLLFALQAFTSFSQVRVRGYTRKDGTYVRPHTRSYPGGGYSSSSSSGSSSSYSDYSSGGGRRVKTVIDGVESSFSESDFKDGKYRVDDDLTLYKPRYAFDNAIPVYEASSDLSAFSPAKTKKKLLKSYADKAEQSNMVFDTTGHPVYLSVLRVNGRVVDIATFYRNSLYDNQVDFSNNIYHVIDKSVFTAEQALELIDKYNFESKEGILKTTLNVTYGKIKLPPFITHKVEVMHLR